MSPDEISAAQNLSALQHWEDGTPNVRGQLTSLWVLGERPRGEPIRYAPPPLPEPEPPCCSAPVLPTRLRTLGRTRIRIQGAGDGTRF